MIYKELYYTKDMGVTWNYMTNYVFDFEWAASKLDTSKQIPDERVFVTRDPENEGHQSYNGDNWSVDINMYVSDDLFATAPTMALESGNTIVKTDQYMVVA